MTFRMGENGAVIDFVLIMKEHRWSMRNMKVIPGELLHALVVVDIDEKIWNAMRKTCAVRRKISLLKNVMIRK